jgi:hypothetical protein
MGKGAGLYQTNVQEGPVKKQGNPACDGGHRGEALRLLLITGADILSF